jgi:PAS domain S-box-containing protein
MDVKRNDAPGSGSSSFRVVSITVLLAGGIFLLDMLTPLDLVAWLLYFIPLLVISRARSLASLIFATAATVLIVAGYFMQSYLDPAVPDFRQSAANRLLAVGVLWTVAITLMQRRRIEEALKESEERFRTLITHALVGFFILQEGQVIFLNPEAEKLFVAISEGFAAERLADGVHPEDLPRFAAFLMAAHGEEERDRAHETEFRFAPRGPEAEERDPGDIASHGPFHRWVHCRTSPIVYRGKRAALVNMVDITRVKELERIALVQEKMASLGQVATGIAHEIRNPLSGLNLYLSAAERMVADADGISEDTKTAALDAFSRMGSISEKIDGIVRSILEFARPEPLRFELIDVCEAVHEAVRLAAAMLRKEGVRLEVRHPAEPLLCRADARLLEQVVLNLLTNAAQAVEGKEGEKRIAVASAREGKYAVVTVADSGPGVPLHLRDKIFDPFFTTKKEGTGIGLSLSHKIVSDHGGFIRVGQSHLGGALFTVELPLDDAGPAAGF